MNTAFQSRHVLEERLSAARSEPGADHVSVLGHAAIFSVLAHKGHEAWVESALAGLPEVAARFAGPGEWLVVSEARGADALARELAALDPQRLSFAEQGDGRVALRLSGPNARAILSKCVAVDLHPAAFAEGRAGNMLFCHVGANLARTGPDSFEIVLMRSYAGFAFDELMEMGREFHLTAAFST